jgi:segregation and condensation protein B
MEITNLIPHIEALIFASDKGLTTLELTELANNAFGFMEDKITLDQVEAAVEGINEKYASEFYPFEMKQSGGGWQFLTKKDFHKTVAQLNGEKFLKRLSTAALETLAIIAYKQPITKADIEAIRGVSCDYSIQKLLEKELVMITGRNEDLPGKPLVYVTSKTFMDYFGLNSADELPKLKEIFDEAMVPPTQMQKHTLPNENGQGGIEEESAPLVVLENGELREAGLESLAPSDDISNEESEALADESADDITSLDEKANLETVNEDAYESQPDAESEDSNDEPDSGEENEEDSEEDREDADERK